MVKGRLPRESNPLPGDKSGFAASHDTTGEEDYKRTSPLNPLPVTSIGDSNVKDAAVKTELELIKQGIADNKATNDLILARLDNPIDTQLTGSNTDKVLTKTLSFSELEAGESESLLFKPSKNSVAQIINFTFQLRLPNDTAENKVSLSFFYGDSADIDFSLLKVDNSNLASGESRIYLDVTRIRYGNVSSPLSIAETSVDNLKPKQKELINDYIANFTFSEDTPLTITLKNDTEFKLPTGFKKLVIIYKEVGGLA